MLFDLSSVDLLILSACDSAAGFWSNETLEGLASAMDFAGTRAMVATISPVASAVTKPVMTRFHKELLRGATPARALQLSILSGAEEPDAEYASPAWWAPFVVIGKQRSLFPPPSAPAQP